MDSLETKILKTKAEIACSGYLTGWEIIHYKKRLKSLEERQKFIKGSCISTQLEF